MTRNIVQKRNLPPWPGRFLLVSGPKLEPRPKTERGMSFDSPARQESQGITRSNPPATDRRWGALLPGRFPADMTVFGGNKVEPPCRGVSQKGNKSALALLHA